MELLIKGSTELNKMFMALQRTAIGLRHDFGEVENLQQSLRGARDFVKKAAARIEEKAAEIAGDAGDAYEAPEGRRGPQRGE